MANEFWAAIIGAVVGGIIAFLIQLIILVAAARLRSTERDERTKALAHALLFKVIRIHSNLHGLQQHLEETTAKIAENATDRRPWQCYLPLANMPPEVTFSTDEMAMLLALGDDDLFNGLVSFDEVHNGTISVVKSLNIRREQLTKGLPAKMDGDRGDTFLTAEQVQYLEPKWYEFDSLFYVVKKRCDSEEDNSKNLLAKLHTRLVEKAGVTLSLQFNTTNDD